MSCGRRGRENAREARLFIFADTAIIVPWGKASQRHIYLV